MKKIFIALSLLVCAIPFTSCDAVDDLTEFDLSVSLSENLNIDVPEGVTTLGASVDFDYGQVQEIADNINRIEEVAIDTFTYTITNAGGNADAIIENVSLTFSGTTVALTSFNPTEAALSAQVFTVTDTAALNALGDALLSNPELELSFTGTVIGAPVNFTANFDIDVTVTVDAI